MLLVPLAINYYQPGWNAILKQTPILANSSSLFRWFGVYVPIACLLACLTLDHEPLFSRYRPVIAAAGVLIVIGMNFARDRSYYAAQAFDPLPVTEAYERVRSGAWSPRVDRIAVALDDQGEEALVRFRNVSLADGASQMLCYETLFGFRLELFNRGVLKEGDVMQSEAGLLNLKNPACYVYPEENGCEPGAHFRVEQAAAAVSFTSYEPYDFNLSRAQRIGNFTSLAVGATLLLLSSVCIVRRLRIAAKRDPLISRARVWRRD
jgi:hypothetical protein